ncbi:MAG: aminoglycoside resistance protein, partial [Mycobacterium sp.]|nr:aminoglycoside resistance protein [Mycobacterium sp.]
MRDHRTAARRGHRRDRRHAAPRSRRRAVSRFAVPAGVQEMARRGPQWADWVQSLPSILHRVAGQWNLRPDGPPAHGHCSLVLPVRTDDGAAMLKIGFPDQESEHEHLALRGWSGRGAVRLLSADPGVRALLLERLHPVDLSAGNRPAAEALTIVAGLYRQLHIAAMPSLRDLSACVGRWSGELTKLPRGAPIPRRLVEQAAALGPQLCRDRTVPDRVLHTDLHYGNVLAGDRAPWLAIDPKPVNGDPHYELAPLLWNRWDEIAGDVRGGVRRRLWTLVEAAGFDADRARAWVIVRMVHNA